MVNIRPKLFDSISKQEKWIALQDPWLFHPFFGLAFPPSDTVSERTASWRSDSALAGPFSEAHDLKARPESRAKVRLLRDSAKLI